VKIFGFLLELVLEFRSEFPTAGGRRETALPKRWGTLVGRIRTCWLKAQSKLLPLNLGAASGVSFLLEGRESSHAERFQEYFDR